MTSKTFVYRPNIIKMATITLLFGFISTFAALGSHDASGPRVVARLLNNVGLDISQVFKIVGFLGIGMSIVALAILVYTSFAAGRVITISKEKVLIPRNFFSSKVLEVRASDITNVSVNEVFGQKSIRVNHLAGEIDIPSSMFPNMKTFDECYSAISSVH